MAYVSKYRHAKMSARKVRLVTDMIRGKNIHDALASLDFSKKRAATMVAKTLRAAVANAENVSEGEVDTRRLVVTEARVDEGPTMKRFQPKDRGRAFQILKRTSHITVAVDER
ncbi:MAG: 50S ribosomal protein L22 [Planctomycetota bacterium]|jgi:large subunit ribosomal protein L22